MEGESSPKPTQVDIGKSLLRNYFTQLSPTQQEEGIVLSQVKRELEERGIEIKYKYLYEAYKKLEAEVRQAAEEGRTVTPIPKLKETHDPTRADEVARLRREGVPDDEISKLLGGIKQDTITGYANERGESRAITTQFSDEQMIQAADVYNNGGDINAVEKAMGLDRNGAMAVLAAAKRRGIVDRKTPTPDVKAAREDFLRKIFLEGYSPEEMFERLQKEAFPSLSLSRIKALYTGFLEGLPFRLHGYDQIQRWRDEQKRKYAQMSPVTPDESRDVVQEQEIEEIPDQQPTHVEEPEEPPKEVEQIRPFYQPEESDLVLPQRNVSKQDKKKEFERQKRKQAEAELLRQQQADEAHRLKQQNQD